MKHPFKALLSTALLCALLVLGQTTPRWLHANEIPYLTRLNTQSGLSQDSVLSMLIDTQGFLWLGTENGLNRYDGYEVVQIKGPNNIFSEALITALFEDPQGFIWVGIETHGIYRFDPKHQRIDFTLQIPIQKSSAWMQSAQHIFVDEKQHYWFVLDQQIVSLNPNSMEVKTQYTLTDEIDTFENAIRFAILRGDLLLIGTSAGLYARDIKSNISKKITFLPAKQQSSKNTNVKYLESYNSDIWIGTLSGLYSLPLSAIREFLHDTDTKSLSSTTLVADLNIWGVHHQFSSVFYLTTDDGLYSYNGVSGELKRLFKLTSGPFYITDNNITTLAKDKSDNLWLGSIADGAFHWSPRSMRFNNISSRTDSSASNQLNHNHIWSFYPQASDKLWVGSSIGLNLYNPLNGNIQSFLVAEESGNVHSGTSVDRILPWDDNQLVLTTSEGLTLFNTNSLRTEAFPLKKSSDKALLQGPIWAVALSHDHNLLFIRHEGVYQYQRNSQTIRRFDALDQQIDFVDSYDIIGFVPNRPGKYWITATDKIWQWDRDSGELLKVLDISDNNKQLMAFAESFVVGKNNLLWVTFPGRGLYALDSLTLQQKYHFDTNNGLPNNNVYGLQKDSNGNLWMSSHSGLIKLNPDTFHIQQFTHEAGLLSNEFNVHAHARLADNRLAYGSNKGFTLFEPSQFTAAMQSDEKTVTITSAGLFNRTLNLGFTALNDQLLELNYDDVGLRIAFSTLAYEQQNQTRYQYQLSGDENIQYPITRVPHVIFPKLSPGNYLFEVAAFDLETGAKTTSANLRIVVRPALWASPIAIATYVLLLFTLLLLWLKARADQSRQLKQAHRETLNTKNRLKLALDASNSGIWEWRALEDKCYSSRTSNELGYLESESALSTKQHLDLIHPEDRELFQQVWSQFISSDEGRFDITYRLRNINGNYLWFRDVGSIVSDPEASSVQVAGTYTNITENLANEEKVKLFGEAFKHTRDWVLIFNDNYQAIAANQAFNDSFGIVEQLALDDQVRKALLPKGQALPRFWKKLYSLDQDSYWKGEDKIQLNSSKSLNVLVHITPVSSSNQQQSVDHYLMIMSDISEQKEAESELRKLANYDTLTGLPNRTLFLDRVEHAIEHARRQEMVLAVMFIDLDKFKQVNDSLGHDAGDELLQVIAKRLTEQLREGDTIARLGGDEFVVMLEGIAQPDRLSLLAEKMITTLETPILLGNQMVSISASIGISLYPNDAVSPTDMLKNADIAMYHAKEMGRSNFKYFTEHMNIQAKERLALENQLKKAHKNQDFTCYYQPIVDSDTRNIIGFELLMRWQTEEGFISPERFIPVAEELGLIEDMTWQVLHQAIPLIKQWHASGYPLYLSINLSARHFEKHLSIEQLVSLLEFNDLPIDTFRFEITESALMRDYEKAQEYMHEITSKGFKIALDDFGTGYSSLKYLKEFPIEIIKIDRSFVQDIGHDKNDEAIIQAIISMADSLDLQCIAEGIEQEDQIEFLREHKCNQLQGFFFSKPIPGLETMELIKKFNGEAKKE